MAKVYPFSEIMIAVMKAKNIGYADIQDMLEEIGVNKIEKKRLSEYGRQISTPPYEKAHEIIKVLEIEMSEEDLLESLKLNRKLIRQNKENQSNSLRERTAGGMEKNLIKTVTINYKGFIEGMTAEQVEERINQRIITLYGEKNIGKTDRTRLAEYIRDLIRKDIRTEDKKL